MTIAGAPPTAPRALLQRGGATAGGEAKNGGVAATGVLTAAAVVLPRRGRCGGGGIRGGSLDQAAAATIRGRNTVNQGDCRRTSAPTLPSLTDGPTSTAHP